MEGRVSEGGERRGWEEAREGVGRGKGLGRRRGRSWGEERGGVGKENWGDEG